MKEASPCECPVAGYCARHKKRKTERSHHLCQTDSKYRRLWDRLALGLPASELKLVVKPPKICRAGCQLTKLLGYIGIHYTPDCPCKIHAAEMDAMGPQWCRDNMEKILGWMRTEAKNRKLPFVKLAAKRIVLLAIRRAEKAIAAAETDDSVSESAEEVLPALPESLTHPLPDTTTPTG